MTRRAELIGLDVGGTNIRGVRTTPAGGPVAQVELRRPEEPTQIVDAIVEVAGRLRDAPGDAPVGAVGVGCAGTVDTDGVVWRSPNIPTLVAFPLAAALEERLTVPVVVDNDATTACWAELVAGAAVGTSDAVFVALGTGIGGAIVLDGALRRGAHGFAGEIGHMVVETDGLWCVCGRRGCWETVASGSALGRRAREVAGSGAAPRLVASAGGDPAAVTAEHLVALVDHSDPAALAVLADHGRAVARGIDVLVQALDVATVVIGGGLSDIGAPLLSSVARGYELAAVDADHRPAVEIVLAHHGGQAGAVGAALLAGEAIGPGE